MRNRAGKGRGDRLSMGRLRMRSEEGVSVVELAIAIPILIILALVIVEGSWAFAQHRDVQRGADEAAVLASNNYGTVGQIAQEACWRLDVVYPATHPNVIVSPQAGDGSAGSSGTVTMESRFHTLTGLFDRMFRNMRLRGSQDFLVETPEEGETLWWNGSSGGAHRCI